MTTTGLTSSEEVVGTLRWACFCGQDNETEVTRHDLDGGFVDGYCAGNHYHLQTFTLDGDWNQ
jgi:hypothetical protein